MKPIRPNRYHFPARDRAEEIPGQILRLARRAKTLNKTDLTNELYRLAAAAQEHVLGMSTRLTIQERLAENHEYELDLARAEGARDGVATAIGESFDPAGFFVYILWGSSPDRPLYVGQSSNIFGRLGTHLGVTRKRRQVQRVQLMRCVNAKTMRTLEARLIRQYRPAWNVNGVVRGDFRTAPRFRPTA